MSFPSRTPPELAARVPKNAIDSSIGQTGNGLAGLTGRCAWLWISGAAGMRACAGWRCSDRQNSGCTNVEVRIKSGWKLEDRRSRSKPRRDTQL